MGEVTKEQRKHIIKEFGECERILTYIYGAVKSPEDLKRYSAAYYDRLSKMAFDLFNRSSGLTRYINRMDSEECPFNTFQGDIGSVHHTADSTLAQVAMIVSSLKYEYFKEDLTRSDNAEIERAHHENLLAQIFYGINCFKTFRKIATDGYAPEKFNIRPFLQRLLSDRAHFKHAPVKLDAMLEDALILFDKEALYWITMRMLSNAERATLDMRGDGRIQVLAGYYKDGNFYLTVRNNGKTIKERADEAAKRNGGKSKPNIERICKEFKTNFLLRDSKSKDFTVTACIRLPVANEQSRLVDKWAK